MKYETLEIEITDRVATVFMNRPQVHNAFNDRMIADLTDFFTKINDMEDVVVMILRGREKSFCAGADLNWMKGGAKNTHEENFCDSLLLAKLFLQIYVCEKPTIAVVHGVSLGGANGLLSACDMAYAENDATFSLSEVKIGIVPACISPYVIKRVGEYGAKDLMLTGKRIKGPEAEWYRLVNKSLPKEELEGYVNSVVEMLKTSGPKAVMQCKKLINDVCNELELDDMHEYTAKMIADIRSSEEGQEGMAAFLEKRKPNWVK